jgi:HlyD family secretion protein
MIELLCRIAFLAAFLSGCGPAEAGLVFNGYVEGEYVLVAPRESGRIKELLVRAGETVEAGQLLFELEDESLLQEVAEARSRLAQAKAQVRNLEEGKREEEIAVLEAQLAEARAGLAEAERTLARQDVLVRDGISPRATLDAAQATRDRAAAQVASMERQIAVARMPARQAELEAARRNVDAEEAALARIEWRLAQLHVKAPASGMVDEVLRRPGEMAGPDAPVISLLPPQNRIVRFFVPERVRSSVQPGMAVNVACDACPAGMTARVSFVSSRAEFTPPVIFSVESRQKLVFAVEARPTGEAAVLSPGQPVDVRLPEGRE